METIGRRVEVSRPGGMPRGSHRDDGTTKGNLGTGAGPEHLRQSRGRREHRKELWSVQKHYGALLSPACGGRSPGKHTDFPGRNSEGDSLTSS